MQISVIIPTYNRAEILRKTLMGYAQQAGDHHMSEVLVIDDGSKDHTADVVRECASLFSIPLRYLHQQNSGQAAARNRAIREAQYDLILFGDDDVLPSSRLAEQHAAWHKRFPDENIGVMGSVPWLTSVRPTPFMQWSGFYGPQFNVKPGMEIDFRYGFFCNTSVKASFLAQHGLFSEAFRTYGYEDVELSYRLSKQGYKLLYNPDAVGYHNKYERMENTIQRIEALYRAWPGFSKTEAGKHYLEMWRAQQRPPSGMKAAAKTLLRPLKAVAIPMVRPLVDTHVPLPGWLYNQIFSHYVTPFSAVVAAWERDTLNGANTLCNKEQAAVEEECGTHKTGSRER